MHWPSKMFISSSIQCSTSDKNTFKIELTKNFSKGIYFKILPRYHMRKIGD